MVEWDAVAMETERDAARWNNKTMHKNMITAITVRFRREGNTALHVIFSVTDISDSDKIL